MERSLFDLGLYDIRESVAQLNFEASFNAGTFATSTRHRFKWLNDMLPGTRIRTRSELLVFVKTNAKTTLDQPVSSILQLISNNFLVCSIRQHCD